MPTLSLRAEIYSQTVPLLEKVHVVAIHPEPCLLCSTHGGHCDYWQVTFPDGAPVVALPPVALLSLPHPEMTNVPAASTPTKPPNRLSFNSVPHLCD